MGKKTKPPHDTPLQFRSRIVGEGMEAPDQLLANPQNWRRHPKEQLAALEGLLDTVGWVQRVIVNRVTGHMVDGHARVELALRRDEKQVPVLYVDLSADEERLVLASLDPIGGLAQTDQAMLDELLDGVESGSAGLDEFLAGLRGEEAGGAAGKTDPDDVPPVEKEAVSIAGDVWVLGRHRVMCGDSISAADVARLMGDERAALLQTDPPYGIAYVANAKSKGQAQAHTDIANDDLDGEKLQAFLEACIRAALPHLNDNCAFYLWHPMLTQGTFFAAAAAAADILIHRQVIWVKPSMVFGRGDYHWQHELCFYGWRRGNRPPFYGPRSQTTIWQVGRETSKEHPTAKPVDLWARPIENHTKVGEVMYEPFSGSGSQVIAAEQAGRRCFAMELAGIYVDVAVRRWQAYTGLQATLEGDGRTFDQIAAERAAVEA
jgi:DNA modification methylase